MKGVESHVDSGVHGRVRFERRWRHLLVICFTLGACGIGDDLRHQSQIFGTVQASVADRFRDPQSTQFRGMKFGSPGYVCGEVNAKNGFGGYVGFTRFYSDTLGNATIESQSSRDFRTHWTASCDSVRFPNAAARQQFLAEIDSIENAHAKERADSLKRAEAIEAGHRRTSIALKERIDSLVRAGVHPFIGWRSRRVMFSVWCDWETIPHSQRKLLVTEEDGQREGYRMVTTVECGSDRR